MDRSAARSIQPRCHIRRRTLFVVRTEPTPLERPARAIENKDKQREGKDENQDTRKDTPSGLHAGADVDVSVCASCANSFSRGGA